MGTEGCQISAGLWFSCVELKMQSHIQDLWLHGLERFRAVGFYPAHRGSSFTGGYCFPLHLEGSHPAPILCS